MTTFVTAAAAAPGIRPATDAHLAAQHAAFAGANLDEDIGRAELIRTVEIAGPLLGLRTAQLAYLVHCIRLTREGDWRGGQHPTIWRSLMRAAQDHHVDTRTVQRWESTLIDLGLATFQDYGNRRRFGRRDQDGEIKYAFGIDLSPLAARYDELSDMADRHRAEVDEWNDTWRCLIEARARLRALCRRLGRTPPASPRRCGLEVPASELARMHAELELEYNRLAATLAAAGPAAEDTVAEPAAAVDEVPEVCVPDENASSAGENTVSEPSEAVENAPEICGQNENLSPMGDIHVTHNYTTNHPVSLQSNTLYGRAGTPPPCEPATPDPDKQPEKKGVVPEGGEGGRPGSAVPDTGVQHVDPSHIAAIATPRLNELFPDHAPPDWDDVIAAAEVLRHDLGTSIFAWRRAIALIGPSATALCIVIAHIRHADPLDQVRNPGGFLTGCVSAAARGDLHLHGSVFGLLERRRRSDVQ